MRSHIIALLVFVLVVAAGCRDERSEEGDRFFEKKEYQKAIEAYTEYLTLDPTNVKALYNRGRAYEELGKYELAVPDFQKVLKEDPKNVSALLSLAGDYFSRKQDYQNTVYYAEKAIKLDENNARAHTLKGKGHQKLGNVEEAMAAYNAALSVDREYIDAYLSRGLLRVYLNQNAKACADFRMASSLGYKSADRLVERYCK